uniref:Uncharacterized protein n=1 Tax=Romanomermis culicivorax TaxID=13658 RepID=A0A915IK67_ROMCU
MQKVEGLRPHMALFFRCASHVDLGMQQWCFAASQVLTHKVMKETKLKSVTRMSNIYKNEYQRAWYNNF